MWLLVLVLTIILWLILDNVLIAAMLAIFALFLFTTTRALWLTRKQAKEQTLEVNKVGEVSGLTQGSGVKEQGVDEPIITPQISQLEDGASEVDESYLSLMEELKPPKG